MMRYLSLAVFCCVLAVPALAGQGNPTDLDIWTDADGDGLPDPTGNVAAGMATFDVWVDLKTGTYTNFGIYLDVGGDAFFNRDAMEVTYTPFWTGTVFPLDDFTNPNAIGIGGSDFTLTGMVKMATLSLPTVAASMTDEACITPIVDFYNPYYTYCIFQNGSDYGSFSTGQASASCWTTSTATAVEATSWGKVKTLFN